MCTLLTMDETAIARERSIEDTRKDVDKLIAFDRKLSEPFTRKELKELFSETGFQLYFLYTSPREILNEDELKIVSELGVDSLKLRGFLERENHENVNVPQERRWLKAQFVAAPHFHGYGSAHFKQSDNIRVARVSCRDQRSRKREYYFVRYRKSISCVFTTAYEYPDLVVERNKLRPDQVAYMERKCKESRKTS